MKMTDNDQTNPDSPEEAIAPEPEGPPPEPSVPAAEPAVGLPNGASESAIDISLDERRRLLDFLEEMHHEQAVERRQWFALIERLSAERHAGEWWPLRIWHWLIADTPEPSIAPGPPAYRRPGRAPRNGTSADSTESP